jgi:anion-transporting  ArsA/GET3 family ATPase
VSGIDSLLTTREIVVTCGSGGVGKTTLAAALGVRAVLEHGGSVLVLTVDPAKRLASALGLEAIGNVERRIDVPGAKGELWAAMLDTKASWDDLVRRHAPDPATRDAILANRLYANITGTFVQSHEYIAVERLFDLHASGRFDLIVVDTPPSRNALDFLDAPDRMAEFFGGRLLRWLTAGYRNRLVNLASRPLTQLADRILGSAFLADITEFFTLFATMETGFRQRAEAVRSLLADTRTSFVLVSTLEPAPAREAAFFVRELAARRLNLGAVVLNKVLPAAALEPTVQQAAAMLAADIDGVAHEMARGVGDADLVARVLRELLTNAANLEAAARREAAEREQLAGAADVLVELPLLDHDLTDLAALSALLSP